MLTELPSRKIYLLPLSTIFVLLSDLFITKTSLFKYTENSTTPSLAPPPPPPPPKKKKKKKKKKKIKKNENFEITILISFKFLLKT